MTKWYGENQDDRFAALILPQFGYYIDVGAHDGVTASNTLYFAERGWEGVCVEPHPQVFQHLQANRGADALCLQYAVDRESRERVPFQSTPIGAYGGLRITPYTRQRARDERGIQQYKTIEVDTLTLRDIILEANLPAVDLLSVDVEGVEADVLAGYPWAWHKPALIIVERNDPQAIRRVLEPQGYMRAITLPLGANDFWVRTTEDMIILQEAYYALAH